MIRKSLLLTALFFITGFGLNSCFDFSYSWGVTHKKSSNHRQAVSPATGYIVSGYGYRPDPFNPSRREFHSGIDIRANYGTPIVSLMSGYVTQAGWNGGYGKSVTIKSGSTYNIYGHCSKIRVKVGQYVESGEIIGYVGSTGRSTGQHLHFEVVENGRRVNPKKWLANKDFEIANNRKSSGINIKRKNKSKRNNIILAKKEDGNSHIHTETTGISTVARVSLPALNVTQNNTTTDEIDVSPRVSVPESDVVNFMNGILQTADSNGVSPPPKTNIVNTEGRFSAEFGVIEVSNRVLGPSNKTDLYVKADGEEIISVNKEINEAPETPFVNLYGKARLLEGNYRIKILSKTCNIFNECEYREMEYTIYVEGNKSTEMNVVTIYN